MRQNVVHALRGGRRRPRAVVVLIAVAGIVTACTAPMRQAAVHQPAPCGDSLYVQLKRTHPDSLSERAWQHLQSLDRECAATRTRAHTETSGMMGMGHGRGGAWIGTGIVAMVLMVIMMSALR